jgi:enterochelin esterase-like enzyme
VIGGLLAHDAVAAPVTAAHLATAVAAPTVAALPTTTAPPSPMRVVDTRYPTPSLGGDRRVIIALPVGYDNSTSRYPVIEILHGRPGKPDDILTGLDLLSIMGSTSPFIAVLPDGHGPQVSDGDFADTSRQRLGAAMSEDLRSWIDATYRTTGMWGVTGLSSGGYGAAYLASRPQGGYRRACPMSGYFTAEDPPFKGESSIVRDAASPLLHVATDGPPTLLIVGDADSAGLKEARSYVSAMNRVGQSNQLVIVPGGHDFKVWHAGLSHCIEFLLAANA